MKIRRLIPNIYIGGVLAALSGCGTQDYALDEPIEAISPVVETYDWEQAVEDSKNRPASLSFGGGFNTERVVGLRQNEDCPSQSLCIEAPFFGAHQLKALSSQYADFKEWEENGRVVVTYKSNTPLVIKAEVFELEASLIFESCARDTTISARHVRGRGEIKTSSVLCNTNDAGDLQIAAIEVKDIMLNTSGETGRDGKNGEDSDPFIKVLGGKPSDPSQSPSKSGALQPRWFRVAWGRAYDSDVNGPICITEKACQYKNTHFPAHEAGRFQASSKPWETAQQNLELLKRAKMWPVAAERFLNDRRREMSGCWVETKPFLSVEGEVAAGLYLDWKIEVNKAALKGADSTLSARGEPGENGGNAGELSVVTLAHSAFEVENEGGKSGTNGKHFYATPGRGAEFSVAQSFDPEASPSRGIWVSCFQEHKFSRIGMWYEVEPLKNQKGFFARKKNKVSPQPALRAVPKRFLGEKGFVSWEVVDWPIEFQLQTDKISPRSNEVFGSELRREGNKLFGESGRAAYRVFEELPTPIDGKSKQARLQFVDEAESFFSTVELQGVEFLPKSLQLELKSLREAQEQDDSSESAER